MKERNIEIEKEGIVHVLKVDEDGNPITGRKEEKVLIEKKKTVWFEWQFYVCLFVYFLFHTIARSLFSSSSIMGILHFVLVEETYRNIWLDSKAITFKKISKTIFWLVGGNLLLFIIAVILSSILDL